MENKMQSFRYYLVVGIIAGLIFTPFLPLRPVKAQETSSSLVHFVMSAMWGNVEGDATTRAKTVYDGSISIDGEGKVSLISTLKFDGHDKMTSEEDPVSWQSYIFGHKDGLVVRVSATPESKVVVTTQQGTLSTTAQALNDATSEIKQETESSREIVVKTYPLAKNHFFKKIWWGNLDQEMTLYRVGDALEKFDASGSLTVDQKGKLKLKRTLRFDQKGDKVNTDTTSEIAWTSNIGLGKDGLLVKFNLTEVDSTDTVTLTFSSEEFNWQETFNLVDLYHTQEIKRSIPINGEERGFELLIASHFRPNKTLLKAKDESAVYEIEDGTKRYIPSPAVFKARDLAWGKIIKVSKEELEAYPKGKALGLPDGTLIKGSKPKVYVVSDGEKRPFISPSAFLDLGYQWKNIEVITDKDLAVYPEGPALSTESSHPEGALIRVKGTPGVYQIKDGRRKPIASRAIFEANRLKWENVLEVAEAKLEALEQAEKVHWPDGALLKGSTSGVYLVEKGKKRAFRSAEDYRGLGYQWDQIVRVTDKDLVELESGSDVVGDEL